jgi:hypothetical protein
MERDSSIRQREALNVSPSGIWGDNGPTIDCFIKAGTD